MSIRRLALLAGVAVLAAGCTATAPDTAPASSATDHACASFASYQRAPGTTVTFLVGSLMQPEAPLQTTWADFTRCTGIRIVNEVDLGSTGGGAGPP